VEEKHRILSKLVLSSVFMQILELKYLIFQDQFIIQHSITEIVYQSTLLKKVLINFP